MLLLLFIKEKNVGILCCAPGSPTLFREGSVALTAGSAIQSLAVEPL